MSTPIPPLRRFTSKVMGRWSVKTVGFRSDGTGLCSRTGTALLALFADRVGLTGGLCDALRGHARSAARGMCRAGCSVDLAVMLADGGRWVSDLAALGGQVSLFGEVASVSTARRVVLLVSGGEELAGIRARGVRQGAGVGGGCRTRAGDPRLRRHPDRRSLRRSTQPALQGRLGFNPLLVTCGREVLAGILRPGNAGTDDAADHLKLFDLALEQLPQSALDRGRSSAF